MLTLTLRVPSPRIDIAPDRRTCGARAAAAAARRLHELIETQGKASLIVATGASQLDVLEQLTQESNLRWDRVTVFHLDEYLGLPLTHPASFRRYLWERFHSRLPRPLHAFHYLNGEADAETERRRYASLLAQHPIDLALIGIGENGHIAFNDPPADFTTQERCLAVTLDDACRQQQLGEGWFSTLEEVPRQALSLSVWQIMQSRTLIVTVPDERKAVAVRRALTGEITPDVPASILQQHSAAWFFLDAAAASQLPPTSHP